MQDLDKKGRKRLKSIKIEIWGGAVAVFKKAAFLVIVILILLSNIVPVTAERSNDITLIINNKTIKSDTPPLIYKNRTMVPIRIVSETLGAEVFWHSSERQVEIKTHNRIIKLTIDKNEALINEKKVTLDVSAKIFNNRTMVPLRFVGEALGADVFWDGSTRTVKVVKKSQQIINVAYAKTPEGLDVLIDASGPVEYEQLFLQNPNRLILDFPSTKVALQVPVVNVGKNGVKQIRVGQFKVDPDITRVVIDLEKEMSYSIHTSENKKQVVVCFKNQMFGVDYSKEELGQSALIKTPFDTEYSVNELSEPDRIVIDLHDAEFNADSSNIEINDEILYRIRMAQFSVNPDVVRVVFDLKEKADYTVEPVEGEGLKVYFNKYKKLEEVRFKKFSNRTRLVFKTNDPVDFRVEREDKQLTVEIPQAVIKISQNVLPVDDGIVDNIELKQVEENGGIKVVAVIKLPYYYKHEIINTCPTEEVIVDIFKSPLSEELIVVDAGHGGDEPGAISPSGVKEKDLTLDIAKRLNELLLDGGAKTYMIRSTDITVPYQIRPNIANEMKADLFFSIHINAYYNDRIQGVETLYCSGSSGESKKIAKLVQETMVEELGMVDRGIWERENLVVLRETKMPAVLAEVGYLTHPEDEKKLLDPEFRQKAAEALYKGILKYYEQKD